MYTYIFDHFIKNRKCRALSKINLVCNTSFFNDGKTDFIILTVDVQSQYLERN
ncbi:hypothetical protein Hanom_Chr17g01567781 [Helianthus anomalus]